MAIRTKVSVASRALTMIGADPITSLSDGTAEAIAATQHYDSTVETEFSLYPWSFAKNQAALNLLVDTPASTWEYAWQLPNELINVVRVEVNDNTIPFERFGSKIFCNEDADVVATYVFRATETSWPPYFEDLIVHRLGAIFATAIAERPKLAEGLLFETQNMRMMARNMDSASQTTSRLPVGKLRRSRLGNRS